MKPTSTIFWRWQQQTSLTTSPTAFALVIDDDIANQVIRQVPDDRD